MAQTNNNKEWLRLALLDYCSHKITQRWSALLFFSNEPESISESTFTMEAPEDYFAGKDESWFRLSFRGAGIANLSDLKSAAGPAWTEFIRLINELSTVLAKDLQEVKTMLDSGQPLNKERVRSLKEKYDGRIAEIRKQLGIDIKETELPHGREGELAA